MSEQELACPFCGGEMQHVEGRKYICKRCGSERIGDPAIHIIVLYFRREAG